ncbi:MAG: hypothetical protein QOH13_80, partial [Thermoleophilaceae bacterium]|nr:hypothetical protein [Thermoleophilaceae bacterium]
MTLKLKHLPAVLGLTAALLALPSAAFAKGAFQFQSDQKHVAIQSMTSDGMGSFQMVLTFPVAVTEATTAQGAPCELNFRNDPKTIECHVPVAAGTPQPSSLDLMATIAEALGCDATIAHESSVDNRTYRDDGTIVRSGDCPTATPPPPPPPEPTPQPGPDPN